MLSEILVLTLNVNTNVLHLRLICMYIIHVLCIHSIHNMYTIHIMLLYIV